MTNKGRKGQDKCKLIIISYVYNHFNTSTSATTTDRLNDGQTTGKQTDRPTNTQQANRQIDLRQTGIQDIRSLARPNYILMSFFNMKGVTRKDLPLWKVGSKA